MQTKDITVFQLRAARSGLGMTISYLSKVTGISRSTITNIESQNAVLPPSCNLTTVFRLKTFFEKAGILFENKNTVSLKDDLLSPDI